MNEFEPNDMFNADEKGLFFGCLPDKTLAFSCENASGWKKPKERLTVPVAANMSGIKNISF